MLLQTKAESDSENQVRTGTGINFPDDGSSTMGGKKKTKQEEVLQ